MSTEADLEVVSVERVDGIEVIVEFSDGTCATYTAARLAEIAPNRLKVDWNRNDPNGSANGGAAG